MSPDEVDDAWKPPIPKLDAYQTTTSQNENMCPCPKDYCKVGTLIIQVYLRNLNFEDCYQIEVSKNWPSVVLQISSDFKSPRKSEDPETANFCINISIT